MPGLFDSLKDGLMGMFGGPGEPLIHAGAAVLQSDQPGLAALGAGAQAGQGARRLVEAEAKKLQNQREIMAIVQDGGMDFEAMQGVFLRTLGSGDIESARTMAEVMKVMQTVQGAQSGRATMIDTVVNPTVAPAAVVARFGEGTAVQVPFDPGTHKFSWESAVPVIPDEPSTPRTQVVEVDGRKRLISSVTGNTIQDLGAVPPRVYEVSGPDDETINFAQFNPTTGSMEVLPGDLRPIIGRGGSAGEDGGPNKPEYGMVQSVMAELDSAYDPSLAEIPTARLLDWSKGTGFIGDVANLAVGTLKPEAQQAAAAQGRVTAHLVRIMSGAQMTDAEFQRYRSAFGIRGGDTPEVIEQKYRALQFLMNRLQEVYGNEAYRKSRFVAGADENIDDSWMREFGVDEYEAFDEAGQAAIRAAFEEAMAISGGYAITPFAPSDGNSDGN